ncbi:hypothetical protein [Agromyces atrinae]|uniref:Lytic transglycosylase domain-containing protein n=1 Tax=Agromyces atrinae TaxID=592376 RepID=A0A852SFD7_9MICO|nr:hypothetical protein [Agromyces atrinae]NYD66281.1 hypothetical protein [Agromyces atrinae]
MRDSILAAGAIVTIGALAGTGFVIQSAVTAQNERIAETAALTNSRGLDAEHLQHASTVLDARAAQKAEITLADASAAIAAAAGKTDAAALETTVASLAQHDLLAPKRIFLLSEQAAEQAAAVKAATAEADRIAAEAAAAAAAEAAAAEAAAAEAAASASVGASRPTAPSNPSEAQAIARDMMAANYGWGDDQFGCLVALWNKESGWNVNAYNSSSGATGIPQALPGNKMASAGADWQTNPATQIAWGLGYIANRHGSPCGAWEHSESSGWY